MKYEFLTQEHFLAAISWISKMCSSEYWNLTDSEAAKLLGMKDTATYKELVTQALTNQSIFMSDETSERISLLLGIWKYSQILAPANRADLAIKLFNTPNSSSLLQGNSIKDFLLQNNSISHFYTIKRYLASTANGY